MLAWSSITNQGERPRNEDFIGNRIIGDRACYVLCDGLGGHGKGEIASRMIVQSVLEDFEQYYQRDSFLEYSLRRAQERLLQYQENKQCKSEAKTTVVCLLIDGSYVQWAYAGDSRLYRFVKKRLKEHTLDHSVPQMMVASKELKEKDIRFHEDRNRLLKVMGVDIGKTPYQIMKPIELKNEQQFLLCTDGFWEWIVEKDMNKLLKMADTPENWLQNMTKKVLECGSGRGMDNYSAIAVWIQK